MGAALAGGGCGASRRTIYPDAGDAPEDAGRVEDAGGHAFDAGYDAGFDAGSGKDAGVEPDAGCPENPEDCCYDAWEVCERCGIDICAVCACIM